jgi:hypothetical protein
MYSIVLYNNNNNNIISSQGNAVSIATVYGLNKRGVGVRVLVGARIFSMSSRPFLEPTQPHIRWVKGTLSPELKQPGREDDRSAQTSAEIKKLGSIHHLPHARSWRSVVSQAQGQHFTYTII